jgi:hypothetical protein
MTAMDIFEKCTNFILISSRAEVAGFECNLRMPQRVFAMITGVIPPPYERLSELGSDLEALYHTIVMDFLSPLRIVVGHHGFKKEKTLREHVYKLLSNARNNGNGLGVSLFPQLTLGGRFSLVKGNGLPYMCSLSKGMWPFLLSSRANPMLLLLESVWTKLDTLFNLGAFSDDLEQERLNPCLFARAVKKDSLYGWEYRFEDIPESALLAAGPTRQWVPVKLTEVEAIIITLLLKGRDVVTTSKDFIALASSHGTASDELIGKLLDTHLVARQNDRLVLIPEDCAMVITPDGTFAAENNAGLLTSWSLKSN